MTPHKLSSFAAVLCFILVPFMHAQESPVERVAEIQAALRDAKLDGWLFYDFRHSDPLAYRILKLDEKMLASRRWFYYIPASGDTGENCAVDRAVQARARFPGGKLIFRGWQELHARLREVLAPAAKESKRRIAMQYSPMNDIPYISRVDAGTIELVRSFGIEPVTSAELVQRFEAVFSPAQHEMQVEASDKMHRIIQERLRRLRAGFAPMTNHRVGHRAVHAASLQGRRDGAGADDRGGERECRESALHADKGKELANQTRRFRVDRCGYEPAKPEAVATDQTWTGYVGESVPEEYSRIFNIVREARDSAVDFVRKNIRAGKTIRGAEVDDVSRGVITHAGFGEQFTHRTGHSIGEETHGNGVNIDDFETRDSRRIIPGVCFSIEPGIYLEGKFGVRSEINVYVSDKDIEVTGQPIQTEIIPILKSR